VRDRFLGIEAIVLPPDLRSALERELTGAPRRDITSASRNLSQRYRSQPADNTSPFLQTQLDAVAYAAYRLPATFAAIRAVLAEVRDRKPEFHPETLLDAGAGPGTVAWATVDVWPGLEEIVAVERDPHMTDIGKALAAHAHSPAIRDLRWRQADVREVWDAGPAGLTVAACNLLLLRI